MDAAVATAHIFSLFMCLLQFSGSTVDEDQLIFGHCSALVRPKSVCNSRELSSSCGPSYLLVHTISEHSPSLDGQRAKNNALLKNFMLIHVAIYFLKSAYAACVHSLDLK